MPNRTFAHKAAVLSAGVTVVLATSAAAQPAFVDLTGVVRDFRASHPDFGLDSATAGHFAGNVALAVDIGGRPVYTGGGYRVATEWTDGDGRNIAPHMFGVAAGSCAGAVVGAHATANIWIGNQSEVRGYVYGSVAPGGVPAIISTNTTSSGECEIIGNSELWGDFLVGPGADPANVVRTTPNGYIYGDTGALPAPIPVPEVVLPTGLGPSLGDLVYSSGVSQITTDLHVSSLTITSSARVVVPSGSHVTILVDGNLLIDANADPTNGLFVEPDASLELYTTADSDVDILSSRLVAVNGDPRLIHFYKLGEASGSVNSRDIDLRGNGSVMNCTAIAPGADLEMTQSSEFWGNFIGREVDLENRCLLYLDMSAPGGAAGDTAGVAGLVGDSIDSAASFGQWFSNVLGENLSRSHTITLTLNGGVYEYLDDAFFPVNGLLYGNEGESANFGFTCRFDASFTHESCAGQFVEFLGADDAWLFINGALVMDLGGVRPLVPQHVDLDRLGLTDGVEYALSLMYAQRNLVQAAFRLRTNIVLTS
ncbi:MAG: fibro-slime domain-containing protein, partial [Planctomycetota bacterium]